MGARIRRIGETFALCASGPAGGETAKTGICVWRKTPSVTEPKNLFRYPLNPRVPSTTQIGFFLAGDLQNLERGFPRAYDQLGRSGPTPPT